jgi:coenzyme F420-reducing hydrogenase beta subunit
MLKYMFENDFIQTALSFQYNEATLQYEPKLIYVYSDYLITGSIYHEINLYDFIRRHYKEIKGKIFLFLLPCQVKPIKYILNKNKIAHFTVALTCSSQQSIEATYYLLKLLKTKKDDVRHIQYRGNGWPSGINIKLQTGEDIFLPNNKPLWQDIFHSRLFIQKRCFSCTETISEKSDVSLADPWIKEVIETEEIGKTLIAINSEQGDFYLNKAENDGIIVKSEMAMASLIQSQIYTIKRKELYKKNKRMNRIIKIISSSLYKNIILKNRTLFNLHNKILHKVEAGLSRKS